MKQAKENRIIINGKNRSFGSVRFVRLMKVSIYILFLIYLLSTATALSFGQSIERDSTNNPIILFVYEHGAARSPIAVAYFNEPAKEKD